MGQLDETDEAEDTTANLTVYPDEPPKSGEWVDTEDVLHGLTEEEAEAGRRMGEEIDPEDDDSGGWAD